MLPDLGILLAIFLVLLVQIFRSKVWKHSSLSDSFEEVYNLTTRLPALNKCLVWFADESTYRETNV